MAWFEWHGGSTRLVFGMVWALGGLACGPAVGVAETGSQSASDTDGSGESSSRPPTTCRDDGECGAFMVCEGGACVPSAAQTTGGGEPDGDPAVECVFQQDCAAGFACEDGRCSPIAIVPRCDRYDLGTPAPTGVVTRDAPPLALVDADGDGALEVLAVSPEGELTVYGDLGGAVTMTRVFTDPWNEIVELLAVDLDLDGDDDFLARYWDHPEDGDVALFEAVGDGTYTELSTRSGDGHDFVVGRVRAQPEVDVVGGWADGLRVLGTNGLSVTYDRRLRSIAHVAVAIGPLNDDDLDDVVVDASGNIEVLYGGADFPEQTELLYDGYGSERALDVSAYASDAQPGIASLLERGADVLVEVWPHRPAAASWTPSRASLEVDTAFEEAMGRYPLSVTPLDIDADGATELLLSGRDTVGVLYDVGEPGMCFDPTTASLGQRGHFAVGDIDADGRDEMAYVAGEELVILDAML